MMAMGWSMYYEGMEAMRVARNYAKAAKRSLQKVQSLTQAWGCLHVAKYRIPGVLFKVLYFMAARGLFEHTEDIQNDNFWWILMLIHDNSWSPVAPNPKGISSKNFCKDAVGHANTAAVTTLFNRKIERAAPIGAFAARTLTVVPEDETMLEGATTVQPTLFEEFGDEWETELEEATTVQPDAPYEPTELPFADEELHEWDALS